MSERKIVQYMTLRFPAPGLLDQEVQNLLRSGWEVHGLPLHYTNIHHQTEHLQTMVKYEVTP